MDAPDRQVNPGSLAARLGEAIAISACPQWASKPTLYR